MTRLPPVFLIRPVPVRLPLLLSTKLAGKSTSPPVLATLRFVKVPVPVNVWSVAPTRLTVPLIVPALVRFPLINRVVEGVTVTALVSTFARVAALLTVCVPVNFTKLVPASSWPAAATVKPPETNNVLLPRPIPVLGV